MSILILYESDEWSNVYLRDRLISRGYDVLFHNFETEDLVAEQLSSAGLIVNRLFPSAYFRGHIKTYTEAGRFMRHLHMMGIPMINSYEAFVYDFDKILVCRKLAAEGINVPRIYCTLKDLDLSVIRYPCIVKPNQGGRSMDTFVAFSIYDLREKIKYLPPVEFLIQEYIASPDQQTIRIEVIGSKIISAFKRSINNEGISSFSRGSNYTPICTDNETVSADCLRIMQLLNLKMASFDLIAGETGLFVIDVNATSNFASSDVSLNGFNPLDLMAELIISEYNCISDNPPHVQAMRQPYDATPPRA